MSSSRKALLAAAAVVFVGSGCEPPRPSLAIPPPANLWLEPPKPPAAATRDDTLLNVGLDGTAIDKTVDPCSDFYAFACGNWIKKTEIPADRARYVRSFTAIADKNEAELHAILEDAAKAKGPDPVTQKIGSYYAACMDEPTIDKAGTKPLAPLLAAVKKVRDTKTLEAAVIELHKRGIWALFDVSNVQDFKDATQVIAEVDQNGLGLPNKEFYEKPEDKETRDKYQAHVARMLVLGGYSKAKAESGAADVMSIETRIAAISKTPRDRRDPRTRYNRVDRAGLEKLAPHFDWAVYFKSLGFPELTNLTITSPVFFQGLDQLLSDVKPAAWQNYLTWHVLRATAALLPKAFVDESFSMEQVLSGQKEVRARWKRCVGATDDALGELLAQPFVKRNFSPESKTQMEAYVAAVSKAFASEVDKLDWMDDATKARAKAKLVAMEYLIGYPSKWRSYDFTVKPEGYAENALASRAFDLQFALSKVGKPVDRGEWHMTPPTVNAYYEASKNHMVFPAGILQPPFYSPKANIPVNLGAIGMVVGHELTHGFDDRGAQFDDKGNMVDWWSPGVSDKFKAKTQCVNDEYGGFEPLPGLHIDGKLTLGENIADNAGIKLAFAAYRAMREGAVEVSVADGFTEDQQFFLGAAQAWCTVQHDDQIRTQVKTNSHSPSKQRINGSVSNLAAFAEAFQCKTGAPMHRANACDVW